MNNCKRYVNTRTPEIRGHDADSRDHPVRDRAHAPQTASAEPRNRQAVTTCSSSFRLICVLRGC